MDRLTLHFDPGTPVRRVIAANLLAPAFEFQADVGVARLAKGAGKSTVAVVLHHNAVGALTVVHEIEGRAEQDEIIRFVLPDDQPGPLIRERKVRQRNGSRQKTLARDGHLREPISARTKEVVERSLS